MVLGLSWVVYGIKATDRIGNIQKFRLSRLVWVRPALEGVLD